MHGMTIVVGLFDHRGNKVSTRPMTIAEAVERYGQRIEPKPTTVVASAGKREWFVVLSSTLGS